MTEIYPIVLCGKTLEVGTKVTPLIRPELEVIEFINDPADIETNIISLLEGRGPVRPLDNDVGSHDYSQPPRAVIFGRAFKAEEVKEIHKRFSGKMDHPIAWIAGDASIVPPANPGPGYAEKAAENVKKALLNWVADGGKDESIVWY